jgi:hypothetical protein
MESFLALRNLHSDFVNVNELFGDISTATISTWLKGIASAASQAVLVGMSREMIILLGDWTNDTVDRYLKSGVQMGINLSKQMGL